MGSGKRFRITWWDSHPIVALGIAVALRSEHEVSIHIDLLKTRIYIGFGKGYEEFERQP